MAEDQDDLILLELAAQLLELCDINGVLESVDDELADDLFYLEVFSRMFPDVPLTGVKENTNNVFEQGQNIEILISLLASLFEDLDLGELSGQEIAQGNKSHICALLDLFLRIGMAIIEQQEAEDAEQEEGAVATQLEQERMGRQLYGEHDHQEHAEEEEQRQIQEHTEDDEEFDRAESADLHDLPLELRDIRTSGSDSKVDQPKDSYNQDEDDEEAHHFAASENNPVATEHLGEVYGQFEQDSERSDEGEAGSGHHHQEQQEKDHDNLSSLHSFVEDDHAEQHGNDEDHHQDLDSCMQEIADLLEKRDHSHDMKAISKSPLCNRKSSNSEAVNELDEDIDEDKISEVSKSQESSAILEAQRAAAAAASDESKKKKNDELSKYNLEADERRAIQDLDENIISLQQGINSAQKNVSHERHQYQYQFSNSIEAENNSGSDQEIEGALQRLEERHSKEIDGIKEFYKKETDAVDVYSDDQENSQKAKDSESLDGDPEMVPFNNDGEGLNSGDIYVDDAEQVPDDQIEVEEYDMEKVYGGGHDELVAESHHDDDKREEIRVSAETFEDQPRFISTSDDHHYMEKYQQQLSEREDYDDRGDYVHQGSQSHSNRRQHSGSKNRPKKHKRPNNVPPLSIPKTLTASTDKDRQGSSSAMSSSLVSSSKSSRRHHKKSHGSSPTREKIRGSASSSQSGSSRKSRKTPRKVEKSEHRSMSHSKSEKKLNNIEQFQENRVPSGHGQEGGFVNHLQLEEQITGVALSKKACMLREAGLLEGQQNGNQRADGDGDAGAGLGAGAVNGNKSAERRVRSADSEASSSRTRSYGSPKSSRTSMSSKKGRGSAKKGKKPKGEKPKKKGKKKRTTKKQPQRVYHEEEPAEYADAEEIDPGMRAWYQNQQLQQEQYEHQHELNYNNDHDGNGQYVDYVDENGYTYQQYEESPDYEYQSEHFDSEESPSGGVDGGSEYVDIYTSLANHIMQKKLDMQRIGQVDLPFDDKQTRDAMERHQRMYWHVLQNQQKEGRMQAMRANHEIERTHTNLSRERKLQEIQQKRFEDELRRDYEARLKRKNHKEVLLCRKIFKVTSNLEKQRLIEQKKAFLEERNVRNEQKRMVLDQISTFYNNQVNMLRERIDEERFARKIASNAQREAISKIEHELKQNRIEEIRRYQEKLDQCEYDPQPEVTSKIQKLYKKKR
eukprot:CAMPEP_0115026130 /NCGR_PEP_ID=MMETSP0216-20121206/34521_1 /TAXON_ID=223996 /ORGANISM="Protocruzia adherens, Strain Boccale" /LENGTH=1185 /DNA_ID=CAMNT_0002401063 /DNA_START=31 /DNA_END=3588 /DNA_ORIENTATION=-